MGIFLGALLFSVLCAFPINYILYYFYEDKIYNKVESYWIIFFIKKLSYIILVIILINPFYYFLWNNTIKKGNNVNISEYSGIGFHPPNEAKNISYYSDYSGTSALFNIEYENLIDWMKILGIKENEIQQGAFSGEFPDMNLSFSVKDGFFAHKQYHPRGTGVHVYYDKKDKLCYYQFSAY